MLLLRLYPRAWRERYEDEMLAVLEEHDVTLATHVDLLRGAVDAWRQLRRPAMAPVPPVVGRTAGLGAIPGVLVAAVFLLGHVMRSQIVANRAGVVVMPAIGLVCLWAGMRVNAGPTWRERLGAGLGAGALTGLVGGAVALLVLFGLFLAQEAFGLWVSPVPPVGASAGGMGVGASAGRLAGSLVKAGALLAIPTTLFADAALGAALGAIGAVLNAVRVGPGRGSPARP